MRAFVYDAASSFRREASEKKPPQTIIQILLGVPNMKISSFGLTLGCAMALAAGSAFANVTPNLQDASGAAVKDGSGACVVSSGAVLPECAGVRAAPAAVPARPAEPAAPTAPVAPAAPATPAAPAKPAPASVR